jgi:hypothetical protein
VTVLRVLQFIAVVLTAVAFVPAGAHLFELPHKIALTEHDYFVVQSIYRGWALFGIVIITAIAANLALALMLWRRREPFWPSLAAGLILGRDAAGVLCVDLSGQPGHQQLDDDDRRLGKAACAMGMVARGECSIEFYCTVLRWRSDSITRFTSDEP